MIPMMKRVLVIFLFSILLCSVTYAGQYKVLKVIDGDTIDVLYMGKKERIRMLCVDTPESVHPDTTRNTAMGKKAAAYTKKRLTYKTVDLEFESKLRGKYGRLLAYVVLGGKNFNIELVRNGWSPYYTKYGTSYRHHIYFVEAQKYAKARSIGIWSDPGADVVQSKKSPVPAESGAYHGNIKSHKFHRPDCRYYNCKKCTRVFDSREASIKAGYKPCGICNP